MFWLYFLVAFFFKLNFFWSDVSIFLSHMESQFCNYLFSVARLHDLILFHYFFGPMYKNFGHTFWIISILNFYLYVFFFPLLHVKLKVFLLNFFFSCINMSHYYVLFFYYTFIHIYNSFIVHRKEIFLHFIFFTYIVFWIAYWINLFHVQLFYK
jgi:hypothetical protein